MAQSPDSYVTDEVIERAADEIRPLVTLSNEQDRTDFLSAVEQALWAVVPDILRKHREDINSFLRLGG